MRRILIGIILAASAICSLARDAQTKTNIFVATGPTTGVYYPIGGGIADVLTKNVPNLNATAGTTDGSMANLLLIQQGTADIALSMADASWDAFKGQDKFQDRQVHVRALMVLYPNRMHIVTVEGTGINKVADLKGKRVSTGAPNSATQIMAYRVLEAAGTRSGEGHHSRATRSGQIGRGDQGQEARCLLLGRRLADLRGDRSRRHARHQAEAGRSQPRRSTPMVKKYGPLYVKDTIPAKTYPGQETPTQIVTVWNVLVADAKHERPARLRHRQDVVRSQGGSDPRARRGEELRPEVPEQRRRGDPLPSGREEILRGKRRHAELTN